MLPNHSVRLPVLYMSLLRLISKYIPFGMWDCSGYGSTHMERVNHHEWVYT